MASQVNHIPDGYGVVTPYLIVHDAVAALDFYKRAFGATELMRMDGPNGKIMHAEIAINGGPIMLADEFPEIGALSPKTVGGSPVIIAVYVPDVDALVERAAAAGATVQRPVKDQFYGDRSGSLADPFGHQWVFATHIEDVSPEEMKRRAESAR